MRVFAIDFSGSAECYAGVMLEDAKKRSTDPRDMVVFFSHKTISKTQLLKDATVAGARSGGGDGLEDLFDWMEARTLRPEDELVIYHDGVFPPQILNGIDERWFTPKFVIVTDAFNGGAIDMLDNTGLLFGTMALPALT